MPGRSKQGGKKNRAHGRKKRSASFQRYWTARRHLRRLRRHVHLNPNDRPAAAVLDRKELEPIMAGRDPNLIRLPGGKP